MTSLGFGLEAQQVGERRLRPFDLGGEDGPLADLHIEKEFLTGQEHGNAIQPAEGAFGGAQLG